MTFTRRFLLLVLAAIIPLLISGLVHGLELLAIVWNLGVLAAAVLDYFLCPRPETVLTAERTTDHALSVAAANDVVLTVRSLRDRPFAALVRDEPPPDFAIGPEPGARIRLLKFGPRGEEAIAYTVTPPRRGDFTFGDVYARIAGPLGLVVRQGSVSAKAQVSVYPDLRAVEDYDLTARRASRSMQGVRRLRISSGGREFSSLREYTRDDEYRTIDWKATARRSRVISRTYEAERSQDILLLIDLGRLMRQEIAQTQKIDHVVSSALMLAHVATEADDRVGLLTFASDVRDYLPPRRGRAQANEVLQALYAARAEPIESDYRAAFRFLATRWRKRSLAVLFTDLADSQSSAMLLSEISQLARSHLVVCVVVRDPLAGAQARQRPESAVQVYEKAVAEEVLSDRKRALDILRGRGVLIVDAEPGELSAELVARYLAVKNRGML